MFTLVARCLTSLAVLFFLTAPAAAQPEFVEFESGPVRPVVLSPDGSKLFVTNIPDNTLFVHFLFRFYNFWFAAPAIAFVAISILSPYHDTAPIMEE